MNSIQLYIQYTCVWVILLIPSALCSCKAHLYKTSATRFTFVRLFSWMDPAVCLEVCWSVKLSSTHRAAVRFFPWKTSLATEWDYHQIIIWDGRTILVILILAWCHSCYNWLQKLFKKWSLIHFWKSSTEKRITEGYKNKFLHPILLLFFFLKVFTCVNRLMTSKISFAAEGRRAVVTFVWF